LHLCRHRSGNPHGTKRLPPVNCAHARRRQAISFPTLAQRSVHGRMVEPATVAAVRARGLPFARGGRDARARRARAQAAPQRVGPRRRRRRLLPRRDERTVAVHPALRLRRRHRARRAGQLRAGADAAARARRHPHRRPDAADPSRAGRGHLGAQAGAPALACGLRAADAEDRAGPPAGGGAPCLRAAWRRCGGRDRLRDAFSARRRGGHAVVPHGGRPGVAAALERFRGLRPALARALRGQPHAVPAVPPAQLGAAAPCRRAARLRGKHAGAAASGRGVHARAARCAAVARRRGACRRRDAPRPCRAVQALPRAVTRRGAAQHAAGRRARAARAARRRERDRGGAELRLLAPQPLRGVLPRALRAPAAGHLAKASRLPAASH
jgi:hypothetical protein